MIFSELYSVYYRTVAQILTRIVEDGAQERELQQIVRQFAFEESRLTILPALKSGKWQLMHPDCTTPLRHAPTMPLTDLEKRWLKAISLDRRIRLFGWEPRGLEEVQPLFTEEDFCLYDQYSDGDPYEDPMYVSRFRVILDAVRDRAPIRLRMLNRSGRSITVSCMPERLEYSEKDDKFRLITSGCGRITTVNLAKITDCVRIFGDARLSRYTRAPKRASAVITIRDERNAMERAMMHFAHFEKQAERIGRNLYRLRIYYDAADESELVIRVLSFGPMVQANEPEPFVSLIREKLSRQIECGFR